MIEIYHIPGRGTTIDILLNDGLKSAKKLIEENKIKNYQQSWLFKDHLNVIYFQWFPPHLQHNKQICEWVSIEVCAEATYVYNREFRANGDLKNYLASKMKLIDFIFQHQKTEKMRESLKNGETIIWHPLTAEPIIVDFHDKRLSDFKWQYLNEIIINKPFIPASEFRNYHKF